MNEIILPIPKFEDIYAVSFTGKVWSYRSRKYLKPRVTKSGYREVGLYRHGKRKSSLVHRLVAESFLGEIKNKLEVNHIDGNKLNNRLSNLEIISHGENMKHAVRTGLKKNYFSEKSFASKHTNEQVLEIKKMLSKGVSTKDISLATGIKPWIIHDIKIGKKWSKVVYTKDSDNE